MYCLKYYISDIMWRKEPELDGTSHYAEAAPLPQEKGSDDSKLLHKIRIEVLDG